MKSRFVLFTLSVIVATVVLAACGGAAATQAPATSLDQPAVSEQSAQKVGNGIAAPQSADAVAVAAATQAPAFEISNQSGQDVIVQNTNHKIIKNADIRLQVKDTDIAVNRSTQIVSDLGGYIVSSRIWYQDYYNHNLMYGTLTLGVPVDEFEHALTRLRELSVKVLDETASGEDVTDQYVDLQSQLNNLEATRARIQDFLKDAKTVDEALRVNQQLADIEGQIEQIKGRMNYISDRSAFSTITINFEPVLPELEPVPTPVPQAWMPGETFKAAKRAVTVAYQGIAEVLIWVVVVFLPLFLPPALIFWLLWKLFTRKPKAVVAEK
jgi:Domain of unknown function (DUF4349)